MSSVKPDDRSSQMYSAEEVSGRFVITGSNGTVLFKSGEEFFDEVASFI